MPTPRMMARAAAAALAACAAAPRPAAAADEPAAVRLKLATLAPEGSAWMRSMAAMRDEILKATGGRVQLKAYPGGVLGEEKDVLYKIKVGQVDGAGFMGFGVAKVCPDAEAMGQFFQFRSYEEVDAAMEALRPRLEAQCLQNGFVVLGWTEVGFSYVLSAVPVRSLDDLRAAKPWVLPGSQNIAVFYEIAGISGIPVPVGDVLTALQTGLIKTVYSPPLAAVATQWFTRVKYRSDVKLLYSMGGLFVAEKSWNRVPAELRTPIRDIAARQMRELTRGVRKSNEEALAVIEKSGVSVVSPSPEQVAEFERINREVTKRIVGKTFSPESHAIVTRCLEQLRKETPAP